MAKKEASKKGKWKKGQRIRTMIDGEVYTGVIVTLLSNSAMVQLDEVGDKIDVAYTALEDITTEEPVEQPELDVPEASEDFDIPQEPEEGKKEEEVEETTKEEREAAYRTALERELRRYVARRGGFRDGLSPARRKVALKLMRKLGRKEPKWDESIITVGSTTKNPYKEG